jgi:hypothetical protein
MESLLNRSPIDSISEREVDLLLVSALHENTAFQKWFIRTCTGLEDYKFVGVWRGVFDNYGETDVLCLVDDPSGQRVGLLIEDKINAIFQPGQSERYRNRGEAGLVEGSWGRYICCLFGPSNYVTAYIDGEEWPICVSSEEALEWFDHNNEHNCQIFREALRLSISKKDEGSFAPDHRATEFWQQYRRLCETEFSDLPYQRVREAISKNDPWPKFISDCLPTHILLEHKPTQGRIDLTFSNFSRDEVLEVIGGPPPPPFKIAKAGRSHALRIDVPKLDHLRPFMGQSDRVRACLTGARRLSAFYFDLANR